MPFQILDFVLLGIMLVSGLLALARGFTREVLSLVAWAAAAVAAYFAIQQQKLLDLAQPYTDSPVITKIAVGAIAFIVVLIVVSVISVKISDRVVDSTAGAFDRTLGLFFGLARGLLLVGIAYTFYSGFLQTKDKQEDWISNAVSLPVIESVKSVVIAAVEKFSPDVANSLRQNNPTNPEGAVTPPAPGDVGYSNGQTQGLDNLVEGQAQPPAAEGTNNSQ